MENSTNLQENKAAASCMWFKSHKKSSNKLQATSRLESEHTLNVENVDKQSVQSVRPDWGGTCPGWPNLYLESRDMMALSSLIYSFAYLVETARRHPCFIGLTTKNGQLYRTNACSPHLDRSFSPQDVIELIEKNDSILAETFPKYFRDPSAVLKLLKVMQERAEACLLDRPLTLEEFNDKYQHNELVYGITVNRIDKRVTVVFRGTDNSLACFTSWMTNVRSSKCSVDLPSFFDDKCVGEAHVHSGFYHYLFAKTCDNTDDPTLRKYDEILDHVLRILADLPADYKVYVTGQSLGGALATLTAVFMACDERLPKPISCFTMGTPRVGDMPFLRAVQSLEQHQLLRHARIVNSGDIVAFMPMFNYFHTGIQIRLYRDAKQPLEVSYPRLDATWTAWWWRIWKNSLFNNTNLHYDHGSYVDRIEQYKNELEKLYLNNLYTDCELTGWKIN